MKKIACICMGAFLFNIGTAFSQGEMDAYKLSQTDVNGTARSLSMGGAFGALGGDISSMYTNPAGLGIYRSSEFVTTLSLNMFNTNAAWTGMNSSMNKTTFNLDNFAYVGYFPTGNDYGIVSWNVGFSYNKLKNFNRKYRMRGGSQDFSVSDYIAGIAHLGGYTEADLESTRDYNPYNQQGVSWLPVLGYQSYFINNIGGINWESDFYDDDGFYPVEGAGLEVQERGGIDQYNFSFATNISNVLFLGFNFAVTDMNYRYRSYYTEDFGYGDYLRLNNALATDGTGYSLNVGAIFRPVDFLRVGVAYTSPTWYKMTDNFHAVGASHNSIHDDPYWDTETDLGYSDYRFRTPDKWLFSLAGIIGQNALVSVDYEISNFGRGHLSNYHDGNDWDFRETNDRINDYFKSVNTIKIGAEYKFTPQFAVRAGAYWQSSSAEKYLQENEVEAFTVGTIPHFTVDKGISSFSVGLGYRFTPAFYLDMAYVYRHQKENAYVFSSVYDEAFSIQSTAGSLKTNTNRVALTFGYKF